MSLFPNGGKVFEVISRYDDLLTIEERKDYEPGDTLALIVPFLILHRVSEADITRLAAKATLVKGATELISGLQSSGWETFCITTTYEQYALPITGRLGIKAQNVACTPFPLDKFVRMLSKEEIALLQQMEAEILTMNPRVDDKRIEERLDNYFVEKLPATGLGNAIKMVKPVGGRRKLDALNKFSKAHNQPLSNWVFVGDSITDYRVLEGVNQAGGLAITFNASEYALTKATMGMASLYLSDLAEVVYVFGVGKRKEAEKLVLMEEKEGGSGDRGYFQWLAGKKDIGEAIEVHKRIRRLVREAAAKLG